jgi:inhibitor of KinA sporulation pathway (predicted exonuclease)
MVYIVFDLEATCWPGKSPDGVQEIIEIGAWCVNSFGEVEDKFHSYVRPVINPLLSPYCINLTKIEQQKVNKARTFDYVIEDFIDWVDQNSIGEVLFVSWGDKDVTFMKDDCQRYDIDDDWFSSYFDCKKGYKVLSKRKRAIGISRALDYEDIAFEGQPHSAISDAWNLTKLFVKFLDSWIYV